jgi:hypothetical protein
VLFPIRKVNVTLKELVSGEGITALWRGSIPAFIGALSENAVAFEDGAESAVAVDDADDQKDNNDGDCLEPTNNPRKRKVNLSEYDDDEDVNVLRLNVSSRAVRNEH